MAASTLLLVQAEHPAAERRIIEFRWPPRPVSLDTEPPTRGLQPVEVDAAAPVATNQFDRRPAVLRNDDALAVSGGRDKFGETCFRFAYGEFHDGAFRHEFE